MSAAPVCLETGAESECLPRYVPRSCGFHGIHLISRARRWLTLFHAKFEPPPGLLCEFRAKSSTPDTGEASPAGESRGGFVDGTYSGRTQAVWMSCGPSL